MSDTINIKELTAGRLTHPGEIIGDEITARKTTQSELGRQLGTTKSFISELVNGKRDMNVNLALNLEAIWGVSAEFWMNAQTEYDLKRARRRLANS